MGAEQLRHSWYIAGLSVAALLLLVLVLYQQTLSYLTGIWNDYQTGEYGHGYLVLAISVYLIVRNRRRYASLMPCPNYRALPAVLAACILWLVSVLVDVNMMQVVGLLLLVLAIVWAVLGSRLALVLAFPVLFIGFAIPVWFPLSPLLQDLTADVVFWIIRTLDVPALRQENMIVVPAGNLSIEEACSGLRYLLAALTLGTLYAYLNYATFRARFLVVLISAATAVAANILRVTIVVYLGYSTDMQHPYVHDHLMLGWYLFGGLVVILLFIDMRLYRRYQVSNNSSEPTRSETEHKHSKSSACTKGTMQYIWTAIIAATIISIGPAIVYAVDHRPRVENFDVELVFPSGLGDWSGPVQVEDDWMPVYHGAITQKQRYTKGDEKITLFVGYYPAQNQGEELINDLNRINNKEVWRTRYPRARLKHANGRRVLEQLMERSNGKQRLVWYWYRVSGSNTTSKYQAKALQAIGLMRMDQQAFIVAAAVEINDDIESARETLSEFVIENDKLLQQIATGER